MVHVFNKEARVHSLAHPKPRGHINIRPGDNYIDDAEWKRVEAIAGELIKTGTLVVKTGVDAPAPKAVAKKPTDDEAADKEENEGDAGSDPKTGKKKPRW